MADQPPTPNEPQSGAELIAAERQRQIAVEGYTPSHDRHHARDDLALAAICYATPGPMRQYRAGDVPVDWPWRPQDWKPANDQVRNLVKAGALIAAEIDRLLAREVSP